MINILTLNELKELVELTEREDTTWTRWINQATNDVDNLCNGFVLKTFESTTDEYRITKLKYAIANTVEGYDQNARLFGKSGTTTGGGDAPFSLTTQSDNSAIEYKRQDIIKSLVSGGWYKNLAMDLETPLKDELTNEQTTKLVEFLSGLFLRTDGSNEYLADILNFANGGDIINAGNIVAIDDGFEKTITGYKFEPNADSVINKANMIYDPADAEYKFIDKVDKIAFFGKDLNKALTRQETYNLLSASNTLWNAAYSYEEDVAVLYTFTKAGKEFIGQAISLIDNNMGHNPADGGAFWKVFESTGTADITEIVDKVVEQVDPIIDSKIEALVTLDTDQTITGEKTFQKGIFFQKIAEGKNDTKIENSYGSFLFYNRGDLALRLTSTEVIFANQRLLYIGDPREDRDAVNKRYADNGLALKQNTLTAGTGIDITDNVISSTGSGDVTLDTAQNITGIKTFTNGIKNNLVEVNGKSLIVKNSGGGSNYLEIEQTYTSGYKNWFGVLFFRTTGTSREELSSIQVRQDDGLYISTGNDLVLNAANIKVGDKRIQQVGAPTTDTDAANKKYVDDVISASGGGGGGGTPTNMVTTDTAQTITGIKTFENGIKNNFVEVDGKSLIIKNSNTAASYLEVESVYSGSGYKNWFGIQLFRTTGTSRSRLANLEIRQDDGLYIACVNDVSIQGSNIKFNNVRLQQVGAPTADYDAATKKYVDDVISSTGGGGGSSVVSVDSGEVKEYPLIIGGGQVYIYHAGKLKSGIHNIKTLVPVNTLKRTYWEVDLFYHQRYDATSSTRVSGANLTYQNGILYVDIVSQSRADEYFLTVKYN